MKTREEIRAHILDKFRDYCVGDDEALEEIIDVFEIYEDQWNPSIEFSELKEGDTFTSFGGILEWEKFDTGDKLVHACELCGDSDKNARAPNGVRGRKVHFCQIDRVFPKRPTEDEPSN